MADGRRAGPAPAVCSGSGHPINTSAIGIVVNDLEFGMSILTTQAPDLTNPKSILVPEGTKFTAMRATGKEIAMVGLPKELKFAFADLAP